MRSADHLHTTSRRTLLAQAGVASVIGVTASAAASSPMNPPKEVAALWRERQRIRRQWDALDERKHPDLHEDLSDQYTDLDAEIVKTPSRSRADILAKLEFLRDCCREDPWGGEQGELLEGFLDDLERMLAGGLA
jgi:hypothetical protein